MKNPLFAFDDEVTDPMITSEMTGDQIKRANETREKCIVCETKTKTLLGLNYCPENCDVVAKEFDEFGFVLLDDEDIK